MASGDTLTKKPSAYQALRHRAVLRDADQRDADFERAKGRKYQPMPLAYVDPSRLPLLADYLATHPNIPGVDGWPPSITRSHAARLRQMEVMRATYGPLALLRLSLSGLDTLPLKSAAMTKAARPLIAALQKELCHAGTPFVSAIQRGIGEGDHSHLILPLAGLLPIHAELVQAARPGAGGGCLLLEGRGHGVVIRDTAQDFAKVASYTSRDPDARLDIPDTQGYLEGLEAELARKQMGERVRLAWKGSTPSK